MRYSTPSRARQVVVLDNASIHKTYEFVRKVNVCGGIVLEAMVISTLNAWFAENPGLLPRSRDATK